MRYSHRFFFFFFYFLGDFPLPNLSPPRQIAICCPSLTPDVKKKPQTQTKKPHRGCHLPPPGMVALSGTPQPGLLQSWVDPFPTQLPSVELGSQHDTVALKWKSGVSFYSFSRVEICAGKGSVRSASSVSS